MQARKYKNGRDAGERYSRGQGNERGRGLESLFYEWPRTRNGMLLSLTVDTPFWTPFIRELQ